MEERTLPNPFQWGTQLHRMYEYLGKMESVYNYEFRSVGVLNYTGRISEARTRLHPLGWTIRAERVQGGVWSYRLERLPEKKEPPPKVPGIIGFFWNIMGRFGAGRIS